MQNGLSVKSVVEVKMDILTKIKDLVSNADKEKLFKLYEELSSELENVISSTKESLLDRIEKIHVDKISMALLPKSSQEIPLENAVPLKSSANGDCLYNSASILICGNEHLSKLLRGMVSIELFLHQEFYLDHPYLVTKQKLSQKNIFAICLKHSSTKDLENNEENHRSCLIKEALTNCNVNEWCSMMCMFALSSVIRCQILSIYPSTSTIYNSIFNGSINPRELSGRSMIRIMWSRTTSLITFSSNFETSHFAPVIIRTTEKLTGLKKRKLNTAEKTKSAKSKKLKISNSSKMISRIFPPMKKEKDTNTISTVSNSSPVKSIVNTLISPNKNKTSVIPESFEHIETTTKKDNPNDIINIFDKLSNYSDRDKLSIISNVWKPDSSFVFPKSGCRNSRCQLSYFEKHDWLCYSKLNDSLHCLSCILFPSHSGQKCNFSSQKGFRLWQSASGRLLNHEKSQKHELSNSKLNAFKINRKDPSKAVNVLWSEEKRERIKNNRSRMKALVVCVTYLAKQGISFRGRREDGEYLNDPSNNPGNLKKLLLMCKTLGQPDIMYLLDHAPKNASYTSKTVCNQILDVIGESITDRLIKDVKKAKFFSILADEVQDISNKEQLALVIRFIDNDYNVREEFIKFVHCNKGCSGEAISNLIIEEISNLGLSMNNCRGQAYDGAGAMAGPKKGVAARITNLFPKIVTIHCFSHILNLSVMRLITVQVVKDMFNYCRVISDFFNNSAKRFEMFEKTLTILESKPTKLINICKTRWVQRIKGLARFKEAFKPTYITLTKIERNELFNGNEWNYETRNTAKGLVKTMEEFDFIFALVVSQQLMEYISSLTISLQSSTLAIVEAYETVASVIETLKAVRLFVDTYHSKWYEEAVLLASSIGQEPKRPRTCKVQKHRDNTPADTALEYYRRTITVPVLDEVIEDLVRRFNPENMKFISGFYCIPSLMKKYIKVWKLKLQQFKMAYYDDIPRKDSFEAELDCWQTFWLNNFDGELPNTIKDTMKATIALMFPNMFTILNLLGVIPVTTCTCERCNSVLRRLKTYLRSTMTQDRHNDLILAQVHYGINVDSEEIVNRLVLKYPKRIEMKDILSGE